MAILSAGSNSEIGNSNFKEKLKAYNKSSFYFTKMMTDNSDWSKEAIDLRQKEMASIAVKHWKL